jgi:glycosyltransferase involved in cell wall biosynthesis
MKVLHVIPSLASRTGGPAVAAAEMARVIAGEGVETAVFATDMAHSAITRNPRPVALEELADGSTEAGTRLFPTRSPRRLVYSPELRRALREEVGHFDVVHVHSLYLYPQLAASREAARRNVPYVVSPHGALDPWLRRRRRLRKTVAELAWQRRMLSQAAALHFTSEEEARLTGDVAPGVPRLIVPLGIRSADFEALPPASSFRARFLNGRDGRVVLSLGRLSPKKGLDVLIRAFAIVARELPDTLLVIAGPNDEGLQPELAAIAAQEGVTQQVVFTGMLHGEEKLAALAATDVWALPSHTENFGIAVVEALAAGLPVVISPAVNLAGEIEEAEAGVVCEIHPEAFARAILSLLREQQRSSELGRRARVFARRYDWDVLAPRIVEMYDGIVSRRVADLSRAAGALV